MTTISIVNPYDPHEVFIWTGTLPGI